MTPPPVHVELAELLAQTHWLRALAGSLAGAASEADDLAQDACLVALERPPAGGSARAWLRTVVRNLWSQRRRAERRRTAREQRCEVERPTAVDAADLLVERAIAQRAVVDAVLSLSPPLREVVLLRFFEDLPPRAIAARLVMPVATVHSRLQRALAQLREHLARHHDRNPASRRAWFALLLPSVPALAPAAAMVMNVKLLAAVVVLALGSLLWFTRSEATAAAPDSSLTIAGEHLPATDVSRNDVTTTSPERVAVGDRADAAAAAKLPVPSRSCSGRVVDAEGRAAAGIMLQGGDRSWRSGGDGAFVTQLPRDGVQLVESADSEWQTVMAGVVGEGDALSAVLVVVAPRIRLAGHVRAADGAPVATAMLRVVWPAALRSRLSDIGDRAEPAQLATSCSADGAFALAAGAVRDAELLITANGFVPHRVAVPMRDETTLEVVLESLTAAAGTVHGQVVDLAGRAVAGAQIGLGKALARSDEHGNFAIEDDGEAKALSAIAAGHRRGELLRSEAAFSGFVLLPLGAEPLTIQGRVVDQHGKAVPDVCVWAADLSVLCDSREPIAIEGIASGCASIDELRARFERGEFAGQDPRQVMRSLPTTRWPWVRTGPDGAFTVGGLEQRAYRLRVMDRSSLLMTEVPDVDAGRREVVLVLDRSQLLHELRGVVVGADGTPLPGVAVQVQIDAQGLRNQMMHDQALATATTDERGAFSLRQVPRQHAYLRLDGEHIVPAEPGRRLAGGLAELCAGDPLSLRVEVEVRMHVQVELLDPTRADAIEVLDDAGAAVTLNVFSGRGRRSSEQLPLAEGRSPVFVVPAGVRTLVLKKGDVEVGREVLQLRAGMVNKLQL